jgi:Histidine kinase
MTALENGPGSALPAPEDLHDQVIQDLFTLGLRIQGDAARSEPAVAEQINGYAETLDEVIATIRTSIVGSTCDLIYFRRAGVA